MSMLKVKDITLKVGNMRKPQDFTVYPNGTSEKYIVIQSEKRIAILNKENNRFFINSKNHNYPMFTTLQYDRMEIELTSEQIEEIKRTYASMSNGSNGVISLF